MHKIFIDGKEGTTGLKIFDRLKNRSELELLLLSDEERKKPAARRSMMEQADIVFLCLPDDAAREAVAMMAHCDAKIIDASTAHRTEADWSYGFPELSPAFREQISRGKKIVVPGCHASGFNALVYPLIANGVLPANYPLACFSLTGYSGGGKKMIADYESAERSCEFASPRQYALGQRHKHLNEMRHISNLASPPLFCPVVADFFSGMQVSVPLHTRFLAGKASIGELHAPLSSHYEAANGLVEVMPLGAEPAFLPANALSGRDIMQILVTGNDERINLISTFDNLGKGASGAAVQCMNITLGMPENTGLVL
jgi:N-acetyl-gamma-glutamyl-phosphate reductase